MSDQVLNFAIIGCGRIAPRHAEALDDLATSRSVKLVGTYDVIESRAANLAGKHNARTYPTYDTVLQDPEIHIVSVCVPSGLHAEVALEAARAGKHVLVE